MRESTFSFWRDTDFNALTNKQFEPGQDIYRGRKGEEENWIFEFCNDEGFYINVVFSVYEKESKASLIFKQPNKSEIIEEIDGPFMSANYHLDISIAGNRIYQKDNCYYIDWKSANIEMKLKYKPVLSGWLPGHGKISYGEKGDKYFIWSVPVPRAKVSGSLSIESDTKIITGIGYYDHRRYNFHLSDTMSGALLGRFYAKNFTLIWADFIGNRFYSGKHIPALYLARDQEVLANTGNLEVEVFGNTSLDNLKYPAKISLYACTQPPAKIDINSPVFLAKGLPTTIKSQSVFTHLKGELQRATYPEEVIEGYGIIESFII